MTGLADLARRFGSLEGRDRCIERISPMPRPGRADGRALKAQIKRGKLPGNDEEGCRNRAGIVACFAMGKNWGARKLNYSSDIDLICLFDRDPL